MLVIDTLSLFGRFGLRSTRFEVRQFDLALLDEEQRFVDGGSVGVVDTAIVLEYVGQFKLL